MWNVLFKNVNYLNIVSQKDQIDQNLMKMRIKLIKSNKNKDQMYI